MKLAGKGVQSLDLLMRARESPFVLLTPTALEDWEGEGGMDGGGFLLKEEDTSYWILFMLFVLLQLGWKKNEGRK